MIVIRECEGFEELEACVELQMETWGYDATRHDSAQGISGDAEGGRPGDRRVRHGACRGAAARTAMPAVDGGIRPVFAGSEDGTSCRTASRALICTRTCWR